MRRERLQLALERIPVSRWRRFEEFASQFLVVEFPQLMTMATESGDGGRDAELRVADAQSNTMFQYSVASDWRSKVNATLTRLNEKHPSCRIMVYVTNQRIGAAADDVRSRWRSTYNIWVDVRDLNYFLDRFMQRPEWLDSAESLAQEFADPYLTGKGLYARRASSLEGGELPAAFLHLHMQLADDKRNKGLTKICYEALIRAALRDTSPDRRLTRERIVTSVAQLLPASSAEQVKSGVNAALKRLEKRFLRYYRQSDEYCLTYEERVRLADRLATVEVTENSLELHIVELLEDEATEPLESGDASRLARATRRVIERLLLQKGEAFVAMVKARELAPLHEEELRDIVLAELAVEPFQYEYSQPMDVVFHTVRSCLATTTGTVATYLRQASDCHTLFAFLRETSDVQGALKKLFAHGDIWLDTNVVLPLITETLVDYQPMTLLLKAARGAGLRLRVTTGVVEEVEAHVFGALRAVRKGLNRAGRIPPIYQSYIASGRSPADLEHWARRFRGNVTPSSDVSAYLDVEHGIATIDLEDEVLTAPVGLHEAILTAWRDIHEARDSTRDPSQTARLVAHDVENYLGVMMRRSRDRQSDLGYSSWWLTLDRKALSVRSRAREILKGPIAHSPIIDPDFMAQYLNIGPLRSRVAEGPRSGTPLPIDIGWMDVIDPELLKVADETRASMAGQPEYVVQREVRDAMNAARRSARSLGAGGEWKRVFGDSW